MFLYLVDTAPFSVGPYILHHNTEDRDFPNGSFSAPLTQAQPLPLYPHQQPNPAQSRSKFPLQAGLPENKNINNTGNTSEKRPLEIADNRQCRQGFKLAAGFLSVSGMPAL